MKEKFELLQRALANNEAKGKLIAVAERYDAVYGGKKILGHDFLVTRGALVGAAFECGESAVTGFFDGFDVVVNGKRVSEWLAAYASFEVK